MQPLVVPPLTAIQVEAILRSRSLQVRGGCDRLDSSLQWVEDVSDHLIGGSVTRQMYATVHGTCNLLMDTDYSWGLALFRPYQILSDRNDPNKSVRFDLGVFSLTTPTVEANDLSRSLTGYDRLYFLDRPVGDSYQVAAGVEYLAAMRQVITDAGLVGVSLDGSATGKVLPKAMVWPLIPPEAGSAQDTTWLNVFNDLAAAIGYRGCWADSQGQFRSEPYVTPASRGIEFTMWANVDKTVVGKKRQMAQDVWAAPNRWVFIQQNGATIPTVANGGVYIRTNNNVGPSSIAARGLTWTKTVRLNAADAAALIVQGDKIADADMASNTSYTVETGPFPAAGHFDILEFYDPALGMTQPQKVMATRWQQDILGGQTNWLLTST